MFLGLNPDRALLSDVNPRLIEFLRTIRENPRAVVDAVWRFSNSKACYDRVRRMRPRSAIGDAARFLYLNRTCWGGIYRLNRKGEFNTPFGGSGRTICRLNDVLGPCERFRRARLECRDFESSLSMSCKGDVVYLDPPYAAPDSTSCFARYNQRPFTWTDHLRLGHAATAAARRGALIILSAFWRDELTSMYSDWLATELVRHSRVSRNPGDRRRVREILLFSRVPAGATCAANGKMLTLRRLEPASPTLLPRLFLAG
jgi:DNA adenine methylase